MEWLTDFLPGELSASAAADAMTNGGLPVEVIERHGDDTVIDIEVTSNRGDCLSHLGVGRELSALLNRPFKPLEISANETGPAANTLTRVDIESPLCPHYQARVIRNVKVGPSPQWMVRRLEAVGLRSINNIVDVTNYVMLEMGQPLHAFDYDKLAGRRIVVRQAKAGEKITSIDGHERILQPGMLVIADEKRPVALAGVMGGLETEVSAATVNVLLESARFDHLSVRNTARTLSMKSDSSYRFERGIDPELPQRASLRAAQLILQTAGGELAAGVAEAGQSGCVPRKLTLRMSKLKQVLGIELPPEEVSDALNRLQLSPKRVGEGFEVDIPSWRLDLNIEVDLVEEVARVVGYDKVPVRDEISIRLTPPEPGRVTMELIRSVLVAGGYNEAVTFSWVSDPLARDFVPPEAHDLLRAEHAVRKADGQLRPSLIPGLLEGVGRNESVGNQNVRLYEIGATFWSDPAGAVVEHQRIGLAGGNVRQLRGTIEQLLGRLNAGRSIKISPDRRPGYDPGACGRLEWEGRTIGYLGLVDAGIANKLGLRQTPAIAELESQALLEGVQHVPQLRALPKYPAVRRDLSLVVDERMRYEQVEQLIEGVRPELMEELEYVTTYRGKPLEKGTKSITITLVFRSNQGTLTGEQVEQSVQKVIDAAKSSLNATVRV
ncbi:MAG: phenylalanine--tRNA ligase subunit beta [Phycisphaerales bacterium]|nr:phenylalanine--tRNA ligase subunit beta [Phycisphaerales bacterium]